MHYYARISVTWGDWAAVLLFVQSLIFRAERVVKIYVAVKESLAWYIAEDHLTE